MAHSTTPASGLVETALKNIGAPQDRVVKLSIDDGITAANFEYADLLKCGDVGRLVGAVVEKDGSPLVYIADIPENAHDIGRNLAQLLGNRGETSILLGVHQTAKSEKVVARAWPCKLDASKSKYLDLTNSIDAKTVLGDLQEGLWGSVENAYQEQRLRDLLVNSVDIVSVALQKATSTNFSDDEQGQVVLGLVGRALFTRFLLDRGILAQTTAPALWSILANNGASAFDTPSQAAATCHWLDNTFNGEFMPLPANNGYSSYFENLVQQSPKALEPLGWILHRTDAGGQLPLWEKLDFSHIPAGTLSEVYEDYAHRKAPRKAQRESVHFTPRHIARMMVRQALSGVPENMAATAKVLDPAVGAAVFLSLTFRELARRYALQNNGTWPETKALRNILYSQLCGMDINTSALNLAALTLYLTAIELDANPVPPEKLKFEKRLIGTVLIDVSTINTEDKNASTLGSIRNDLQLGQNFDVVIGNPPWTSLGRNDDSETEETKDGAKVSNAFARAVESVASKCISKRKVTLESNYNHPDKVPDIGFIWKATEWAKEDTGIISLIVHQRLLIKQTKPWRNARRALFSSIEVNGILNAGDFANHDKLIWPGIESPFCVLFARNRKPSENHRSLMLTLNVEPSLNWRRQIRLDPLTTMSISVDDFDERPGGIVVRTKGCELDRALLKRWADRMATDQCNVNVSIDSVKPRRLPLATIGTCIKEFSTGTPKRGFKTGKKNTKLPKWFEDLPQEVRELKATEKSRIAGSINAREITREFIRRPFKSSPDLQWYQPPFLLLRHTPGIRGELARTTVVMPNADETPVLYPYAYIGVPLKRDGEALLYAKYIAVWINSSLYSYFQTLTSTQFTFGIKVVLNDEILDTPVMKLQQALQANLTNPIEIEDLFKRLAHSDKTLQSEIDAWVYKIIGADSHEQRLIEDTLSVSYPISLARRSGKAWVSNSKVAEYIDQLKIELQSSADVIDIESVTEVAMSSILIGWRFLTWRLKTPFVIQNDTHEELQDVSEDELLRLVREKYPQGEVWVTTKDGYFVFGQMALNHLWLPSRASMSAQVMVTWADQCVA